MTDKRQMATVYRGKNSLVGAVLSEPPDTRRKASAEIRLFCDFRGDVLITPGGDEVRFTFDDEASIVGWINALQQMIDARSMDASRWLDTDEATEEKRYKRK